MSFPVCPSALIRRECGLRLPGVVDALDGRRRGDTRITQGAAVGRRFRTVPPVVPVFRRGSLILERRLHLVAVQEEVEDLRRPEGRQAPAEAAEGLEEPHAEVVHRE